MIGVNISVCVTVYFFQFWFRQIFPPWQSPSPRGHRQLELQRRRRCRRWRRRRGKNVVAEALENDQHDRVRWVHWRRRQRFIIRYSNPQIGLFVSMMLRRIDLNHFVINGLKARNPLVVYSLWPKTVEFALWMAPLLSWTKLVPTLSMKLRFFSDDGSHTCSVESSTCDFSGIKRIRLDSSDKVRFWNLIIWNATSVMSNLAIPWKTNISWSLIILAILLIYTERADY